MYLLVILVKMSSHISYVKLLRRSVPSREFRLMDLAYLTLLKLQFNDIHVVIALITPSSWPHLRRNVGLEEGE